MAPDLWDVVIVGAGPAGTSFARKARFSRTEPCAG
jgi:flavin-dependent dehydrogenase